MAVHVSRIFTPFTIYTVTNTLTNVITNNDATKVVSGKEYTATLTVKTGYTSMSVTVMMGGTNITSTSYSNGVITITEVTGDILITATGLSTVAVTITGKGNRRYCYATINGTNYSDAASNIEVMPGDTIVFGVYGYAAVSYGEVVIDGTQTLKVTNRTTKTYNWTVPDGVKTISINLAYTSTSKRYGRITVTTA